MTASRRWAPLLAILALGCAGPGSPDVGIDAGADSGADAGRDGGRDGGRDAGHDADLDAGLLWMPLSGVPSGCELAMASPAYVAARAWTLEPCDDRSGCRRIVAPPPVAGQNPFRVESGHGVHDGSRGLMAIFSDDDVHREEWIIDDSGQALAGFRTAAVSAGITESCFQSDFDVSAREFAFDLSHTVAPDGIANYLYRGALGAPPTLVGDLRAAFTGGWEQEIRVDGPRAAAWMSFQVVLAAELDGTIAAITPNTGGGCEIADVVGDAVFVECVTPTNIEVQLPGGPLTPLFSHGVNYGLDSDGHDMVWGRFALLDDGGVHSELWTAPHTTDPSALVERLLATVPPSDNPEPTDIRVGFGYAALLEQSDRIGVYRLTDGARAQIDSPAGQYWTSFVQYIGPEEIALTAGLPRQDPLTDAQLMFVRIDSLTFVPP